MASIDKPRPALDMFNRFIGIISPYSLLSPVYYITFKNNFKQGQDAGIFKPSNPNSTDSEEDSDADFKGYVGKVDSSFGWVILIVLLVAACVFGAKRLRDRRAREHTEFMELADREVYKGSDDEDDDIEMGRESHDRVIFKSDHIY